MPLILKPKSQDIKIIFINIHQYKTHDPALKINNRYMRYVDIFLIYSP